MSNDLGGSDAARWKQQVQEGDFREIREFLQRSRLDGDWQDRAFMLGLVAEDIAGPLLDAACAAEPNAVDLNLIRTCFYYLQVFKSRGSKRADKTTGDQFHNAALYVEAMLACVGRVVAGDPEDPVPHVFALRGMMVFTAYEADLFRAYQEATRLAPNLIQAHAAMVNARAEKWGGSHAESTQIARAAMAKAQPSDDTPACLFLAHLLVWQYLAGFQNNPAAAKAYLTAPAVTTELNAAFDRWTSETTQVRRCSIPYWHYPAAFYYLARDRNRLQRALYFTNDIFSEAPWNQMGNAADVHANAVTYAATGVVPSSKSPESKKKGIFGWFKR